MSKGEEGGGETGGKEASTSFLGHVTLRWMGITAEDSDQETLVYNLS